MNHITHTKRSVSAGGYATLFGLACALAITALTTNPTVAVPVIKLEPVIISAKRITAPTPVYKLGTVEISATIDMVREAIAQAQREANQIAARTYYADRI